MSQNLLVGGYKEAQHIRSLPQTLFYILFFLPFFVLSSYVFIYIVLPRFLFHRRLVSFLVSLLCLLIFDFAGCYLSGMLYIHITTHIPFGEITFAMNKYHAIAIGAWLSIIVLGLTGGAWVTKSWYLQQRENEFLLKQTITAELKLLKKQIHPRFLLDSLNSLQQDLQNASPDSPNLILKLSDLLSYILYESDYDNVLLEKEITMLRDYIYLEKNNYEGGLNEQIDISGDMTDSYIAPLLLLPFIENGFEYLAEKRELEQSFSLTIHIENEQLYFKLVCRSGSKNKQLENISMQPILMNVQKRLQNLYPHQHQLEITTDSEKFTVDLKLFLNKQQSATIEIEPSVNELYETA